MTPGTFRPKCLIVHVGVTVNTLRSGFCKLQGGMAQPAGDGLVLSDQWKFGGAMVEGQCFQIDLPSGSIMAIQAIHFKPGTMRRCLGEQVQRDTQPED